MRWLKTFLALLIAGIAVLLLLAGPGQLLVEHNSTTNDAVESAPSGGTSVDHFLPQRPGASPVGIEIREGKSIAIRTPQYALRAARYEPLPGGRMLLHDAELDLLDASKPDVVQTTLRAKRARAIVPLERAQEELPDQILELEDVAMRFTQTDAGGPLDLTVPRARAEIQKGAVQTFTSEDAFQLLGDSLRITGTGFDGNAAQRALRIRRDVRVDGLAESEQFRITTAGPAEVTQSASRPGRDSLHADFAESATLRFERPELHRFLELTSDRLAIDLDLHDRKKPRPFAFDASGNVHFATESLEGTSRRAVGLPPPENEELREIELTGPYRVDANLAGGRNALPGVGEARTALLVGEGKAIARRAPDGATTQIEAHGKPSLRLSGDASSALGTVNADTITVEMAGERLTGMATGKAELRTTTTTLTGDRAELGEVDGARTVVVTGTPEAHLVGSAAGSSDSFELGAASLTLLDAGGGATRVVGRERARGSYRGDTFAADRIEATVVDGAARGLELLGSVTAIAQSGRVELRGDRLEIDESRRAVLTGAPAFFGLRENGEVRQSIASPRIVSNDRDVEADGPVIARFPAAAIAGESIAAGESVELHGSRLVATLDANQTLTTATLQGPIRSEGALEVRGERLDLDLVARVHRLTSREGERAMVTGRTPSGSPFHAEAPRFDFHVDSQTIVLAGGGDIDLDGASFDVGPLAKASGPPSSGSVHVHSDGEARIERETAVFAGGVTAKAQGWTLESDRLDTRFAALPAGASRPASAARPPSLEQLVATGNVHVTSSTGLRGTCDRLLYDTVAGRLDISGAAGRDVAFGPYRGAWLSIDSRTLLISSGPGVITFESKQ
ncbi:MAG TPA: hypothetical protein VKE69_13135 [Planctomycetota bacterium]|nr:hypothetical protein [Planctomycetota bacterium]